MKILCRASRGGLFMLSKKEIYKNLRGKGRARPTEKLPLDYLCYIFFPLFVFPFCFFFNQPRATTTDGDMERAAAAEAALLRGKANLLRNSMRRSEEVREGSAAAVDSIGRRMAAVDEAVRPAQVPN